MPAIIKDELLRPNWGWNEHKNQPWSALSPWSLFRSMGGHVVRSASDQDISELIKLLEPSTEWNGGSEASNGQLSFSKRVCVLTKSSRRGTLSKVLVFWVLFKLWTPNLYIAPFLAFCLFVNLKVIGVDHLRILIGVKLCPKSPTVTTNNR